MRGGGVKWEGLKISIRLFEIRSATEKSFQKGDRYTQNQTIYGAKMNGHKQYPNQDFHNHVHLHSNTRSNNLLGVAATVIGIIACLFAWIPFIGILTIPIACIGILLAFIGFILALATRMSIISAICGLLTCLVAFAIGYANVNVSDAIINGPDKTNESSETESEEDTFASAPENQHAMRTVMPSMDLGEDADGEVEDEKTAAQKEKQTTTKGKTEKEAEEMFAEGMTKVLLAAAMGASEEDDDEDDDEKEETKSQTSTHIRLDQKVELENVVFTIKKMEWKEEIKPSKPDSFYSYRKDIEDEIYIVFYATFKNMSGDSVRFTEIPAQLTFNKKFKYNCIVCSDGNDLEVNTSTKPLKNEQILFYASVPNEIADIWQNAELKFGMNNDLAWKMINKLDEVDSVFQLAIQNNQAQ